MTRRRRDERGTVLPLVVGLVAIVLALVTVITDVGALWLQRRALQATVDGGALAGAQAVDLGRVYAEGAHGTLRLDPAAARAAVRAYLASVPASSRQQGFRLAAVTTTGTAVTVRATAVARLPFLSSLTGRGVTLVAQATASTVAD